MVKSIYDLELHEETELDKWTKVMRVPRGWIYKFLIATLQPGDGSVIHAVFVPYQDPLEVAVQLALRRSQRSTTHEVATQGESKPQE